MSVQIRQCVQCGKIGLKLNTEGRCSTCWHRTPAEVWRNLRQNSPADVRIDAFSDPDDLAPLATRLLSVDEIDQILSDTGGFIATAPVRRVEQISSRCIKHTYSDPKTGRTLIRLDLVLAECEGEI